jgi:hypothetical protein
MIFSLVPILGTVLAFFLPGTLMAASVVANYRLSAPRAVLVCVYGGAVNFGLFFACNGPFTRLSRVGLYSGFASLGLALLCAGLFRPRPNAIGRLAIAFAVGAITSVPLWGFLTSTSRPLGNWSLAVAGLIWMWGQHLLHSRFLAVSRGGHK